MEKSNRNLINNKNWIQSDIDFHVFIANKSENKIMTHIIETFVSLMHSSKVIRGWLLDDEEIITNVLQEHKNILRALKEKDSNKSEEMMIVHIDGILKRLEVTEKLLKNGNN